MSDVHLVNEVVGVKRVGGVEVSLDISFVRVWKCGGSLFHSLGGVHTIKKVTKMVRVGCIFGPCKTYKPKMRELLVVSGSRIRTYDLKIMSLASCQTALSRISFKKYLSKAPDAKKRMFAFLILKAPPLLHIGVPPTAPPLPPLTLHCVHIAH